MRIKTWEDFLATTAIVSVLNASTSGNSNSASDNYSVMNFRNPGGFNAITFGWALNAGIGRMGIGDAQIVPLRGSMLLTG